MSKDPNIPRFVKKSKHFSEDDPIFQKVEGMGHSRNEFRGWLIDQEFDLDEEDIISRFLDWKQSLKELVIDESNFDQYFFDIYEHKPKPGQILACYEAMADFIDGNLKRDILHILVSSKKGGEAGPRLMQKLAGATEETALGSSRR